MRKLILTMLLTVVSGNAMAGWLNVGDTEFFSVYADPTTTRKSGDTAKMWVLYDYKKFQKIIGTGELYLSRRYEGEFDCKKEQTRILALVMSAEHMGQGNVLYDVPANGKWKPIAPSSVDETLLKLVCDKK
jgi:hypothetical protein